MKKLLVHVRCGKWFCIKSEDESVGASFLWTEKGRTKSSNRWFAYLFLAYSLFLTPKNDTLIGVETFEVICQYAHGFLITQWAELQNGTAEKERILKLWCNAPQSKPDRQSPSKCLIIDKRVTLCSASSWVMIGAIIWGTTFLILISSHLHSQSLFLSLIQTLQSPSSFYLPCTRSSVSTFYSNSSSSPPTCDRSLCFYLFSNSSSSPLYYT